MALSTTLNRPSFAPRPPGSPNPTGTGNPNTPWMPPRDGYPAGGSLPGGGADAGGFGLGDMGYLPYGVLDALFPYLTFLPNLQAQFAMNAQNIAGSNQNAQIGANAQLGAAGISAQAQMAAVQAGLRESQARMQTDIILAQGGDRNAAARLSAELGLQAQLANQANRLQVAELASLGGLRDSIQARMFTHGVGAQPGFGSSMLAGPLQEITAPNVQYYDYGAAPSIDTNMPNINIPSMPSIGGASGGASVPQLPDFSSLLAGIFGTGATGGPATGSASATAWRPGTAAPSTPTDFAQKQYHRWTPTLMANGGEIRRGGSAIVGDPQRDGRPNPEVVTLTPDGRVIVTPFKGPMAYGGSIVAGDRPTRPTPRPKSKTPTGTSGSATFPVPDSSDAGAEPPPASSVISRPFGKDRLNTWLNRPPAAPAVPPEPAPGPITTGPDAGSGQPPVLPEAPASYDPANPASVPPAAAGTSPIDLSGLPVLQALRQGFATPMSANWAPMSLPEIGINSLPDPAQIANFFRTLPGQDQLDLFDLWNMATGGVLNPQNAIERMNYFTPGYRKFTTPTLGF